MSKTPPPHKRIHARVVKHLPLGLLVETGERQHGIVRVREISWDENKRQNWRSLYPPGWNGWASQTSSRQSQNPEYRWNSPRLSRHKAR